MEHYPLETSVDSQLELKIAMGKVPGFSTIHKFGTTEVAGTTLNDVWSFSGTKQYALSGVPMYIWSDNITDVTDIFIAGLDENWEMKTAVVTIAGQTAVEIPGLWTRIFKMRNVGAPLFAGNIYISRTNTAAGGAPLIADIEAMATALTQGTQMTQYTVPAGHTAFIKNFFASTEKGKDVKTYGFFRPFGGVFTAEEILSTFESPVAKVLPYLSFPEKSDFVVRAVSDVSNTFVSGSYDIILVKNDPHLI